VRVVRYALVAASVAVTGAFFFSRWAINAVVALGVSLLPAAYLLALDYRLLVSR